MHRCAVNINFTQSVDKYFLRLEAQPFLFEGCFSRVYPHG